MQRKKVGIGVLVAGLMAAACGGASPVAASPSATAAPTAAPTQAPRVIKHAMGEITITGIPQRVVVLDTGLLDHVMKHGVKPAGSAEPVAGAGFVKYLNVDPSVTNLGFTRTPDLERVAALKPDLILGSKQYHAAIYDQVSKIGPTVFVEIAGQFWKENLTLIAQALAKQTEAEKIQKDYAALVTDFKAKVGSRLATTKVAYIRAALDKMYIYHNTSFAGMVLKDLGVVRPPAQDQAAPPSFAEAVSKERIKDLDGDIVLAEAVSKERIKDLDGDIVLVSVYGAKGPDTLNAFKSDPLWSQLGAVKANKVFQVDDETWAVGIGYTAAGKVIAEVQKYMAP